MYLDAFTLSALVDEYMDMMVGGKVQDSLDVDSDSIGLEIYASHRRNYLYISADNNYPRLFITPEKLRRGTQKPSQVGLLLRRYVEGGRITHISQPAWERVVHFHIDGPEGEVELIVEPMERRANLLVVQDGIILDCIRRVGPEDNRYRLSLPAHAYQAPPPMTGRRNPFDVTVQDLYGFFDQTQDAKQKTFQVLTGHLLGFSPLLAREVVFRASGDIKESAKQADAEALYDALHTMMQPLKRREWQPGIVQNDEGVSAYSVYPVTHLDGWQAVESINAALLAYYGAPVGEDAYNNAKKPVSAGIAEARARLRGKLDSLERSLKDDAERELMRQSGELILAYQYMLEKGQNELIAQYDADAPPLTIPLDPTLSPLDNAQRYFNKYNKAKRALEDVPTLVEETRNELEYLEQLEMDLELATNWPEIDDVQQALQAGGYWQGKKAKRIGGGGLSGPLRVVTPDGFVLWVGRNSRQNEMVTFKKSNAEDLWLHARQVPGAHVIIKFDGRQIPEDLIQQAAGIAAYYSKRRADGKVPVDVTRIKFVKKIKGAAQGMVTYRNERTLTVTPLNEANLT